MVRESKNKKNMNSGTGRDDDGELMNMVVKPAWLQGLMAETFFASCGAHENRRKNEKNIFCLLCCLSICPHCLPPHRSHPLLQVRRYVYHDVVRLSDLEKLIDCSYIQPYTINGAKVIFLNQRPQTRSKVSSNVCLTCDRILQEPFHFCSLSCKVDHLVYEGEDLSSILYRIDQCDFSYLQFEGLMRGDGPDQLEDYEGGQTNPIADEDPMMHYEGPSAPGISADTTEVVKKAKKKKNSGFLPGIVLSLGSRRKSAPHRAPLS